jgi:hypothetical protein
MIIKLEITEEVLKVISSLYVQEGDYDDVFISGNWLLGGNHMMEDMARVLGEEDSFIKGTENDPEGRSYPQEKEDHWKDVYSFVSRNLFYIMTLVLQYATKGGLTVGEYKAKNNELIWEKING